MTVTDINGKPIAVPYQPGEVVLDPDALAEALYRAHRLDRSCPYQRQSRTPRVQRIKAYIAWVLRELYGMTYTDIGDAVNADHSTIIVRVRNWKSKHSEGVTA